MADTDLMTPAEIEAPDGSAIVRVDGVWYRLVWDNPENMRARIIGAQEPPQIAAFLDAQPLKAWQPPDEDIEEFARDLAGEAA